jgi:flagellar operon protein (TIGR03826 family)
MELIACSKCKKLFNYITGPKICPKCKQEEEVIFQEVKAFLKENPGATVNQVSEATGATITQIEKFLKEGRLEISNNVNIVLKCESCGAKIFTGKFCNKCQAELGHAIQDVKKQMHKIVTEGETQKAVQPDAKNIDRLRFKK